MSFVTFFEGLLQPFFELFGSPDPTVNFGALCVLSVVVISFIGVFLKALKEV